MKERTPLSKIKRLSRILGILIALGIFISALAILSAIKVTKYKTYKNPAYHFSMKYPTYWSIVPRPKELALVIFLAPKVNSLVFTPTVNVTIQPLSQAKLFNFDVFSKEAVRQIAGLFEDRLIVLDSQKVMLAGRRSYRFVYTGKPEGDEEPIYYMHVWFFVDNNAFIITYSAKKSDYPHYLKTVNTMINSFKTF